MDITTDSGFKITKADGYCIGLVTGHNDFERKQYIGVGVGRDEESDAIMVAERGARFYPQM